MSGPRQFKARPRRVAAGLGAVLIAAAIMAPAASAQNGFTLNECTGEGVLGRGASFQATAHTFWSGASVFKAAAPAGCGSQAPNVLWDGTGSGNGRAALGERNALVNPSGDRDASVRFAGSDKPPTTTQVSQIQLGVADANGADVTSADNGKLHVIPVAIGAITVIVNLPGDAGACTVGTDVVDLSPAGNNTSRPKIPNTLLAQAFAGQITTWGQLIPTISGAGCADAPIKRAVRLDSSGSTFAFKDFLSKINAAPWQGLGNTAWPNDGGATAVVRADDSGGGALRTKANDTDGSISYLALSDARGGNQNPFVLTPSTTAHDDKFWLPIQRQDGATYDDPQSAVSGFTSTSVKGANCVNAPIAGVPASTFGDWSKATAVYNNAGYGICTLTYDLAFDDNAVVYCTSDSEQRKARTVRDYLVKAVLSTVGQNGLSGQDYDTLPANVLAISQAGVAQIGWNKGGQGRPCTVAPPVVTPTPTPVATPPATTPPPAPISNTFTIASARVSGTTVRLSLQLPGAGKVSIASSTKPKKGKTITLAAKNVAVTKSGAQAITVSLSSKAKSALKKDKKLKVTLKITYTPNGGTAKTLTKSVTVKQAKKK